ncbi:hypothetical protein VPHF89G1_0005 [Vibrio phage F89 g1]
MSKMKISPTDDCIWFNEDYTLMIDGDTPKEAEIAAEKINNHDRMVEENKKLLTALCDIQGMCIGDIAMGYKLDPESIGMMIYEVTGMTHPELSAKLNQEGEG